MSALTGNYSQLPSQFEIESWDDQGLIDWLATQPEDVQKAFYDQLTDDTGSVNFEQGSVSNFSRFVSTLETVSGFEGVQDYYNGTGLQSSARRFGSVSSYQPSSSSTTSQQPITQERLEQMMFSTNDNTFLQWLFEGIKSLPGTEYNVTTGMFTAQTLELSGAIRTGTFNSLKLTSKQQDFLVRVFKGQSFQFGSQFDIARKINEQQSAVPQEVMTKAQDFFKACNIDSVTDPDSFGSGLVGYFDSAGTDEDAIYQILSSLDSPTESFQFRQMVELSPYSSGRSLEQLLAGEFEGAALGKAIALLKTAPVSEAGFIEVAFRGEIGESYAAIAESETFDEACQENYNYLKNCLQITNLAQAGFTEFSAEELDQMPVYVTATLAACHQNVESDYFASRQIQEAGDGLIGMGQDFSLVESAYSEYQQVYRQFVSEVRSGTYSQETFDALTKNMAEVMRQTQQFDIVENVRRDGIGSVAQATFTAGCAAAAVTATIATFGVAAPVMGTAAAMGAATLGGTAVGTTVAVGSHTVGYGELPSLEEGAEYATDAMMNSGLTAVTMGVGSGSQALVESAVKYGVPKTAATMTSGVVMAETTSVMQTGVREGRLPTGEELVLYGATGMATGGSALAFRQGSVAGVATDVAIEQVEGNLQVVSLTGDLTTADVVANLPGSLSETVRLGQHARAKPGDADSTADGGGPFSREAELSESGVPVDYFESDLDGNPLASFDDGVTDFDGSYSVWPVESEAPVHRPVVDTDADVSTRPVMDADTDVASGPIFPDAPITRTLDDTSLGELVLADPEGYQMARMYQDNPDTFWAYVDAADPDAIRIRDAFGLKKQVVKSDVAPVVYERANPVAEGSSQVALHADLAAPEGSAVSRRSLDQDRGFETVDDPLHDTLDDGIPETGMTFEDGAEMMAADSRGRSVWSSAWNGVVEAVSPQTRINNAFTGWVDGLDIHTSITELSPAQRTIDLGDGVVLEARYAEGRGLYFSQDMGTGIGKPYFPGDQITVGGKKYTIPHSLEQQLTQRKVSMKPSAVIAEVQRPVKKSATDEPVRPQRSVARKRSVSVIEETVHQFSPTGEIGVYKNQSMLDQAVYEIMRRAGDEPVSSLPQSERTIYIFDENNMPISRLVLEDGDRYTVQNHELGKPKDANFTHVMDEHVESAGTEIGNAGCRLPRMDGTPTFVDLTDGTVNYRADGSTGYVHSVSFERQPRPARALGDSGAHVNPHHDMLLPQSVFENDCAVKSLMNSIQLQLIEQGSPMSMSRLSALNEMVIQRALRIQGIQDGYIPDSGLNNKNVHQALAEVLSDLGMTEIRVSRLAEVPFRSTVEGPRSFRLDPDSHLTPDVAASRLNPQTNPAAFGNFNKNNNASQLPKFSHKGLGHGAALQSFDVSSQTLSFVDQLAFEREAQSQHDYHMSEIDAYAARDRVSHPYKAIVYELVDASGNPVSLADAFSQVDWSRVNP